MKKTILFASAFSLMISFPMMAAGDQKPLQKQNWSFNGPTGTFDKAASQRGFQVYKEVCAACHSLNLVAFRTLAALGYNEAEIKAIAGAYEVTDGPDDLGEMFQRKATPADHFPAPYANDKAARAANNGALPPDLSLMIKARVGGADYVYSLLTGYEAPPADVHVPETLHYNPYFPGHQIAMTPPLQDGLLTYSDGSQPTVAQMAHDLVTFLAWVAEPEMERRKEIGFKSLIYLFVFSVLMYFTMRKVWANVK